MEAIVDVADSSQHEICVLSQNKMEQWKARCPEAGGWREGVGSSAQQGRPRCLVGGSTGRLGLL